MEEHIKEMSSIQNELNCQLNPDWEKAGWNFLLAANIEMVEAIEHYGWKWWKHQDPDINQVKMEMVDILHFLLSEFICRGWEADDISREVNNTWNLPVEVDPKEFLRIAKRFISVKDAAMKLHPFVNAYHSLGMSFDDLSRMYYNKLLLNEFRWRNGYKEGTYVKIWNGREDNEVLMEVLSNQETVDAAAVVEQLQEIYNSVVA